MRKRYDAQKLVQRLNEKIGNKLNPRDTLFLGVVLKGLPVAYCLARMNDAVENFIPIVAHRPLHMQHHVDSYFPSPEWQTYFQGRLDNCDNLLFADDVVNTASPSRGWRASCTPSPEKKRFAAGSPPWSSIEETSPTPASFVPVTSLFCG